MNEIFHLGTKVLNEILDKCKTHGDKRGLGYINKYETPFSGESMFVKSKNETLTKSHLLKIHHYAHTIRNKDTLSIGATLSS